MNAELDFRLPDGRHWVHRFDWPERVLRADEPAAVRDCLRDARLAAEAGHWVIGFVSYEAGAAFDDKLSVKPAQGAPLALFAVFREAQELSGGALPGPFEMGHWQSTADREHVQQGIRQIREDIRNGVYYQANYTRQLQAPFAGDALGLFRALHNAQPGRFSLYLDWEQGQVASVSPELFFHWQPAIRQVMTRPMKGTAARGRHPDDDARVAAELAADPKERAENVMIVDLLRNDLGRLAVPGSVHVSDLFRVESLPTVWQMTSTIAATTRPEIALEDIFAALFPCGSVTGAPKGTAMQAIRTLEIEPRGIYCGALGVIAPGGEAVFNVPIRTVQIDRQLDMAHCGIGSGITWSSQPDLEWAEWQAKRRFLWRATAGFQVLETLRLQDGHYPLQAAHLARLAEAARYFGFPWRAAQVEATLMQLAGRHPNGNWRVRLLVDRQGTPLATAYPLEGPLGTDLPPPQPPDPAALAQAPLVHLADRAFVEDPDFVRHKTTWRPGYDAFAPQAATAPGKSECTMQDTAEGMASGTPRGTASGEKASGETAFDTLLWTGEDTLSEFTRGNVALWLDGGWKTPSLDAGLLPGIRRAELLRSGHLQERTLRVEDLAQAPAVLFINSLRGCFPVRVSRHQRTV